jgi:hypothetical protein
MIFLESIETRLSRSTLGPFLLVCLPFCSLLEVTVQFDVAGVDKPITLAVLRAPIAILFLALPVLPGAILLRGIV